MVWTSLKNFMLREAGQVQNNPLIGNFHTEQSLGRSETDGCEVLRKERVWVHSFF